VVSTQPRQVTNAGAIDQFSFDQRHHPPALATATSSAQRQRASTANFQPGKRVWRRSVTIALAR
jgi:hypothetical protein